MTSIRIGLPVTASIALLVFVSSCTSGSSAATARPVNESSAGLQAAVVAVQTQIATLEQQVAGLQATVVAQQTQIATQKQQIAGLQVAPAQPQPPAAPIVATTPGAVGQQFVQALVAEDNRGALALMSIGAQSQFGPKLSAMSAALNGCAGSNVETTTLTAFGSYAVTATFFPPCGNVRDFNIAVAGRDIGSPNKAVNSLTMSVETVNGQSNRVTSIGGS